MEVIATRQGLSVYEITPDKVPPGQRTDEHRNSELHTGGTRVLHQPRGAHPP